MPRASSGWWLEVTGKGNNTRLVPATDELIAELARYRRAHALPPTLQLGETCPLVLPVIGSEGHQKPLSRGALHLILKEVFGLAAERFSANIEVRAPLHALSLTLADLTEHLSQVAAEA